jgi:hypothetical protein
MLRAARTAIAAAAVLLGPDLAATSGSNFTNTHPLTAVDVCFVEPPAHVP